MSTHATRRDFLRGASATGLFGLTGTSFLAQLPAVSAAEAKLDAAKVHFGAEIEPTVRLLEETPREQLLETVAARIHGGLSYREVLAALLLAGVRNVQPRPSVGFKFHAVLVVNSAHLASLSSPAQDRWLPIFWALDEFKDSQQRDITEGDWTMAAVNESAVPPAHQARKAFKTAMDRWDVAGADAAVAALARTAGANQVFELFAHYAARDFRSIGHKAIYVANSWRTLQCIGWQNAEPVLRSLAYALLNHHNEPNPADSDLAPDRPWRTNAALAETIRPEWTGGEVNSAATTDLLGGLRSGSPDDVCATVVQMLNQGIAPQSVYDALLVGAGELLIRQPGIVALHAVTSTNALRYLFSTSSRDKTRRMLLLQNAAFLTLFREAMHGRGKVGDTRIDQLQAAAPPSDSATALAQIFNDVSGDRGVAAEKVLGYLDADQPVKPLIDEARRLIFMKGKNAHDYKFSSAVLEDYYHISPAWRNQFLASSVYNLRGSGDVDNTLVQRTRAALSS